jgi:pyruvate dehydrogenase E2 component (dihydrolipoamide acetyltransferase)
MVIEVRMPRIGVMMKSGTIVEWLKKEGDKVEEGETLCVIETEKFTTEVKAPASGVLLKIIAPENSVLAPTETIAIMAEHYEEVPESLNAPQTSTLAVPVREKAQETEKLTEVSEAKPAKIAKLIPMTAMRRTIAERLSHSHLTAVHVTETMEADVTETLKLLRKVSTEFEKIHGVKVSLTDIIVKAVTTALKEYPSLNSTLDGDQIKIFEDIHMGVAISTPEGLIVGVIFNADKKPLPQVAKDLKKLVEKARQGTISLDETRGSTFTISNLGMFGVETFTPIINPPETAILGVGKVAEKPVVVNQQIIIRSMMPLSLSFDHRVVDGAVAAQFLSRVKQILEQTEFEVT